MPGRLLCDECDETLPRIAPAYACPACGAPYGALVCTECWATEYAFEAAVVLGELDGALSRAVVLHKDAGERRLGGVLGALLGVAVADAWPGWPDAVTWVPPTRAALSRRGFDHARGIAMPVAEALDVACSALLSRVAAYDQRVLGRSARAANASGSFAAGRELTLDAVPRRVLLVDDVLTTGATLDAAADALLTAGCGAVRVAAVARAW